MNSGLRQLFFVGDCLAGALTGAVVTLGVRAVVAAGTDMVFAMLLGMALGTVIHLVVGFLLAPLLGMFETMVPGMFIGMYGGMLFGMRDSMQRIPLLTAIAVGALFGIVVVCGVEFWNAQLRQRATTEKGS